MQFSVEAINEFISWFENFKENIKSLGYEIVDGLNEFNLGLNSTSINQLIGEQKEHTDKLLGEIDSIVLKLKEGLAHDSEQMGIQVENTETSLGG